MCHCGTIFCSCWYDTGYFTNHHPWSLILTGQKRNLKRDENNINYMQNLTVYNPEIIMVINLPRCYNKCTRDNRNTRINTSPTGKTLTNGKYNGKRKQAPQAKHIEMQKPKSHILYHKTTYILYKSRPRSDPLPKNLERNFSSKKYTMPKSGLI